MNRYTLLLLSVTGGLTCGAAWMDIGSGLLLLFGFVPFLLIEDHLYENRKRYSSDAIFTYLIPGFLIFCILSLSWIRVVSIVAAILVITGTSMMMTFAFWLFHRIRLYAGNLTGYVSFISIWLTYEMLCLNISLLSPWINLGNGLSREILFIQWYEVTGSAGGSLWILLSSLFLFLFMKASLYKNSKTILFLVIWLSIIIIPATISVIRFNTIHPSVSGKKEVLLIQPNIDPFKEKFRLPFSEQLSKVLEMAGAEITDSTVWIVTPETTIDDPVDENNTGNDKYIDAIRKFLVKFPSASFVTGMVGYRSNFPASDTAKTENVKERNSPSMSIRNYYNSAFNIDTSGVTEIYHKEKLVPGFEMIPSGQLNTLLKKILPELGGTNAGYSTDQESSCLTSRSAKEAIAPVICYESVYGKKVAEQIKKGAGALFIITNDGWWKNSSGYRQHLSFASIRAIETRRPVARAANTGISCFIDIRGRIVQGTDWWTEETLRGYIVPEKRITPYVKHGDYILNTAALITILLLLSVFIYKPYRRKIG